MSDITKCHGGFCPLKNHCLRYLAKPNPNSQAYIDPPYGLSKDKEFECEMFINVDKHGRKMENNDQ